MARKIGSVREESVAETRGGGGGVVHVAGGGFCQACASVSNNHNNDSHHTTPSGTTTEFTESTTSDEDSSAVESISTTVSPNPYTSSSEQTSLEYTPHAHGRNLNSQASARNHHHYYQHHHPSQQSLQPLHPNNAQHSTAAGSNSDTLTTTPLLTFVLEAVSTLLSNVNSSLRQGQASHMTYRTTLVAVEVLILAIHCCYP